MPFSDIDVLHYLVDYTISRPLSTAVFLSREYLRLQHFKGLGKRKKIIWAYPAACASGRQFRHSAVAPASSSFIRFAHSLLRWPLARGSIALRNNSPCIDKARHKIYLYYVGQMPFKVFFKTPPEPEGSNGMKSKLVLRIIWPFLLRK